MLNKLKNHKNLFMLALMVVISCLTQILALMKSSTVAGIFGTGNDIDAYNFATSTAGFIFSFVAAGISTIIIPSYVKKKNNREVNAFLTLIYGILFVVMMLTIAFRVPLLQLLSGRGESFISVASYSLVIIILTGFLTSVSNITTAFFQCIDRYNTPKVVNLLSHLTVVVILLSVKEISIYQYAWIIALGVVINFVVDTAIALKCGWRIKLDFHFAGEDSKRLLKMFLPVVFSTGIYSLALLTDSIIASRLDEGMVTILSYSNQIASMVNTVVIGNLLIYLYPKIVAHVNNGDSQNFFWDQTAFFHAIDCLIIAGFACVGKEGIKLLFEHGKFGPDATQGVFIGALIYIFGQQFSMLRNLVYRYFYAKGDTKSTAVNSVIVATSNIAISLLLLWLIGFYGIIWGTVASSVISLAAILFKFARKIGFTDVSFPRVMLSYGVNLVITAATVGAVLLTKHFVGAGGTLVRLLVFGAETVVIYVALTFVFNKKVIRAARSL